jgi:hypothetical protein
MATTTANDHEYSTSHVRQTNVVFLALLLLMSYVTVNDSTK